MGSDLAFEFYSYVNNGGKRKPEVMILSGNKPPHLPHEILWSKASDNELLNHVISLGGISREAANDKEFVDVYLSKIRNDYKLYESVNFSSPVEVGANLTVLYGSDDPLLTKIDMAEWSKYSSSGIALKKLPGDHFYFQNDFKKLASLVSEAISDRAMAT